MNAILKVDGNITPLGCFLLPEMSLSSARSEMVKHEFNLIVRAVELINEMNTEYEDWVSESKRDDQMCGGPQDDLAEAGYPALFDLVKNPDLVELTFGYYLINELFDKLFPSKNTKVTFWFDEVTSCSINETGIIFEGVCYSHD